MAIKLTPTGGRTVALRRKRNNGGDFTALPAQAGNTVAQALKKFGVRFVVALGAVALATRFVDKTKRDDGSESYDYKLPLTALGIAWALPEYVLKGRGISKDTARAAGAMAVAFAYGYDDWIEPMLTRNPDSLPAKVFNFFADLFGDKKKKGSSSAQQQQSYGAQQDFGYQQQTPIAGSQPMTSTQPSQVTQPAAQQQPVQQAMSLDSNAQWASALGGILANVGQAAGSIISAGSQAGFWGGAAAADAAAPVGGVQGDAYLSYVSQF